MKINAHIHMSIRCYFQFSYLPVSPAERSLCESWHWNDNRRYLGQRHGYSGYLPPSSQHTSEVLFQLYGLQQLCHCAQYQRWTQTGERQNKSPRRIWTWCNSWHGSSRQSCHCYLKKMHLSDIISMQFTFCTKLYTMLPKYLSWIYVRCSHHIGEWKPLGS